MHKIRLNRPRWAGDLIHLSEDDRARTINRDNIYGIRAHTAIRDTEVEDLGIKPGCQQFLTQADLDWILVVDPLVMMVSTLLPLCLF